MKRTRSKKDVVLKFRGPNCNEWKFLTADPYSMGTGTEQKEFKEEKEEIKNILLASLKMQNLVVLAGAGCSSSVGAPSMIDLWIEAVGDKPSRSAERTARRVHHDLTDRNIEQFLSKIEAYLQINEVQAIRKYLNSCKEVILKKCSSSINFNKLETHKMLLHRLSRRRVRDHRLKIFTTNYDLCFEKAASELGSIVLDGFSFSFPRRYDPRFFGYDIIRRPRSNDDLGHYLEGVFLLFKLHGSVNWARDNEGTIFEKNDPEPGEACLIYPARGKYQQSFAQPHLESMGQFLATLREPNTCMIVVGFGFNDDHLAEPLLAAAQSNSHFRIIIVDPRVDEKISDEDVNPYWSKFDKLSRSGEDIWFIQASFEKFAEMIPDLKSLTPAENLLKTIKNVAREP